MGSIKKLGGFKPSEFFLCVEQTPTKAATLSIISDTPVGVVYLQTGDRHYLVEI